MMRLEGKRVLVTGASSGVGLCLAERLAREGADVALLARGEPGLREAATRVRRYGRRAIVLPTDVSDAGQVGVSVAAAAAEMGGLDLVVSNAAATVFGHFLEVRAEDFQRAVDVTFMGAVNVLRETLPHLRRSRGTVVLTGSLMTRVPLPTFSSYAAAKHALRGFVGSLASRSASSAVACASPWCTRARSTPRCSVV